MLYLLYSGDNYYFTGTDMQDTYFTSLELPFGGFYKTQISPVLYSRLTNKFSLNIFTDAYTDELLFMYAEPYFEQQFPDFQKNNQLQFYFKFTNDNNPFMYAIITPANYFDAIT